MTADDRDDELRAERMRNAASAASITAAMRASRFKELLDDLAADETASPLTRALVAAWRSDEAQFSQRAIAQEEWIWGPAFDPRLTCH